MFGQFPKVDVVANSNSDLDEHKVSQTHEYIATVSHSLVRNDFGRSGAAREKTNDKLLIFMSKTRQMKRLENNRREPVRSQGPGMSQS
jgi:hypothetical protein